MAKREIANDIILKLESIKLTSFELSDYAKQLKKVVSPDNFKFTTTTTFKILLEEKTLSIDIEMSVYENSTEKFLAKICSVTHILVENIKDFVVSENDKSVGLPDDFAFHIFLLGVNASLTSTRGMLVVKAMDTPIENACFPIFDPVKQLPESLRLWYEKKKDSEKEEK